MKKMKFSTDFGWYLLCEEEKAIVTICHTTLQEEASDETPLLLQAKKELLEYFNGKRKKFTFPVKMKGTAFQQKVWETMMEIPYGQLMTYGELAGLVGHPKAARAVGTCCNKNPLGIVVPCHRIVGANRSIGGFAYGVEEKIGLLKLEGCEI